MEQLTARQQSHVERLDALILATIGGGVLRRRELLDAIAEALKGDRKGPESVKLRVALRLRELNHTGAVTCRGRFVYVEGAK